jgi:hypothetical protein
MAPCSTVSETSLMTLSPIETMLTLSRQMLMRSGPPGGTSELKMDFLPRDGDDGRRHIRLRPPEGARRNTAARSGRFGSLRQTPRSPLYRSLIGELVCIRTQYRKWSKRNEKKNFTCWRPGGPTPA